MAAAAGGPVLASASPRLVGLEAIVGQRLVRRICTSCKEQFEPTEEMLMELELTREDTQNRKFHYGRGCDYCNSTGYKGRLGIYEFMVLDDELRELIMTNASADDLRVVAEKYGMITLRKAGMVAAYAGTTTPEEVVRETIIDA